MDCSGSFTVNLAIAEFSFDGFSVDTTRSMVAMSDVSSVIRLTVATYMFMFPIKFRILKTVAWFSLALILFCQVDGTYF